MIANGYRFYPTSVGEANTTNITSEPIEMVVGFEYDMFETVRQLKQRSDLVDPYKLHPNIYQARIDRIERLEFIYDQYRYSLRGDYRAMMYANNLIGCI